MTSIAMEGNVAEHLGKLGVEVYPATKRDEAWENYKQESESIYLVAVLAMHGSAKLGEMLDDWGIDPDERRHRKAREAEGPTSPTLRPCELVSTQLCVKSSVRNTSTSMSPPHQT
jgi:hypothetical protein